MVETFTIKLVRLIAPKYIDSLEQQIIDAQNSANQRVAKMIGDIDPLEPLFTKFSSIFSEVFESPEEGLDEKGYYGFLMWAYTQDGDPYFKHYMKWIMNSEGNNLIRKGHPTPENILYSRALLANCELMRKDVKRLANIYREV